MKLLPPEPQVDLYNEGFGDVDILERKKVSEALSDLVDRIDDPIVIALDGRWGTGKSYFLKRWVGAHKLENESSSTTVFFDAFAHDYLSDPLPALVSALAERLPPGKNKQIQSVKDAAYKLAKPLARMGLSLATFGATRALDELGDAIAEATVEEAKVSMAEYWAAEEKRRNAMDEFRSGIELLAAPVTTDSSGSSVIIVIDELDRCRPDYALEVLEVIKHFFSVPHLHFILGVNLNALENSVRARYGEAIDAQAYLSKFINVTLELPSQLGDEHRRRPANIAYLEHLIAEMGVPKHIGDPLKGQVKMAAKCNDISMRDIGKIVSSVNLASQGVLKKTNWMPGWIILMNDLLITKIVRPDLYPKFLHSSITLPELKSYLGATDSNLKDKINERPNPDFNREIYWRFHTWRYVILDGVVDLEDKRLAEMIGSQFDRFGLEGQARSLPMKIHLRWLDNFSFYEG